jgi:hypothetical protein
MGTGKYTLSEVPDCAGSVVWKREEWKMEERKTFSRLTSDVSLLLLRNLKPSCFNNLSGFISQLEDIDPAVIITEIDGCFRLNIFLFKHFFPKEIKHLESKGTFYCLIEIESDLSNSGVGVKANYRTLSNRFAGLAISSAGD